VKGQDDAPVTIVEVSDYGCGHCRNFNLDTAGLVDDLLIAPGDVRYIIVPYALQSQTAPPAEAALCANEQDRFFDYHFRLFQLQGTPGLYESAGLLGVAAELGLDQDTFESCISTGKYASVVQSNIRAASQAGVNSTPTFFFNDEMFAGNRPLTFFQEQVSQLMDGADAN
jgi:protein-disulfide isomerase